MPLHAPLPAEVIPEPPFIPPVPLPAPPGPRRPYVTWTPNGGPELILSDIVPVGIMLGGTSIDLGVVGLDMPPEDQFESELAGGDGAVDIGRRSPTREVGLPMVIHADTLEMLEIYRRQLVRSFNPRRGFGILRWQMPDSSARELTCRYSGGLDTSAQGRHGYPFAETYIVQVRAVDPYWYGDQQSTSFDAPGGDDFYGYGLGASPYVISSSGTFGEVTVSIAGEVEVYPTWIIRGPCTTATLTNKITGQALNLTPNLAAGQTLTVRTDPRVVAAQKFTREDGSNVWGQVAGDFPVLWALQPGTNDLTVFAAGTGPTSRITLQYKPRYLTA